MSETGESGLRGGTYKITKITDLTIVKMPKYSILPIKIKKNVEEAGTGKASFFSLEQDSTSTKASRMTLTR